MLSLTPTSAEEMASALNEAARAERSITLTGNNSKNLMGGPIRRADVSISTTRLRRVLRYEPEDLTISVEAGMPFSELQSLLAKRGQMIALDPPYAEESTIGGIIASNASGPMRRRFGTGRDLVIGMTFATLDGKLASSGGMVVKNVAGLDMAKILIGSFGTLAAITSINLRLHPIPNAFRTFLLAFPDLESCMQRRNQLLESQLQPIAVDMLSPAAAARLNQRGYILALRAGGSPAVLQRYRQELPDSEILDGDNDAEFWRRIREFTPDFLRRQTAGAVLRISAPLQDLSLLLREISGPSVSRAASGVTYIYLSSFQSVPLVWALAQQHNPPQNGTHQQRWTCVIEFASDEARASADLWLEPESRERQNTFGMMKSVKQMFDSQNLLNQSRLYGRI
ncbi:MAG TPA: FAD-binding oxidoreductase [Bryobacteraceae bacterium]|jgi:glycolate oxidase FAD binding subunit|nr:FAD-binding oxidoreductase [Bryobacteraceae bacterium]